MSPAITDVPGVTIGYATVIEGESARTGVTIIHPRGQENHDPVFAGWFPFNGNGEMTGSAFRRQGAPKSSAEARKQKWKAVRNIIWSRTLPKSRP